MKFKCEICGKVIDPAHVREKAPVTLCPECTEEEIRRLLSLGVYNITTRKPKLALMVREEEEKAKLL